MVLASVRSLVVLHSGLILGVCVSLTANQTILLLHFVVDIDYLFVQRHCLDYTM